MPGKLCRIFLRYRDAYVSMSYRWFNEYKLSFLFGVGAFLISFFKIYFAFYIRRKQDV